MTKSCLKITVPVDSRLQTVYSILEREVYLKAFSHSFIPPNRMHFIVVYNWNKNFETIKSNILENYSKEDYCHYSIQPLDDDTYETIKKLVIEI